MTYSLVAFDPDSGECGVAVQSHWFSVGGLVTWGTPGVGAVATQANVEIAYGPRGLARMAAGASAPEALVELVAADEMAAVRQVAMVDAYGGVGAHTGSDCMSFCGQELGHHHYFRLHKRLKINSCSERSSLIGSFSLVYLPLNSIFVLL